MNCQKRKKNSKKLKSVPEFHGQKSKIITDQHKTGFLQKKKTHKGRTTTYLNKMAHAYHIHNGTTKLTRNENKELKTSKGNPRIHDSMTRDIKPCEINQAVKYNHGVNHCFCCATTEDMEYYITPAQKKESKYFTFSM